jgi:hypothetical protein
MLSIAGMTLRHPFMSPRKLDGFDDKHWRLAHSNGSVKAHQCMVEIAGVDYTPNDSDCAWGHAMNLLEWGKSGYITKD